jgi:16S rRNA (cytidine1402-2'-O)-methyltransferase
MIVYEAPVRVAATCAALADAFGAARPACLSREITKLHEEHVRATLGELAGKYKDVPPRGECVIVVAGGALEQAIDLEAEVRKLLADGLSPKDVAGRLMVVTGKPRRVLYQLALSLARQR